jgi:hypothetical protein
MVGSTVWAAGTIWDATSGRLRPNRFGMFADIPMRDSYPFEVAALALGPPVAALIACLILHLIWRGFQRDARR